MPLLALHYLPPRPLPFGGLTFLPHYTPPTYLPAPTGYLPFCILPVPSLGHFHRHTATIYLHLPGCTRYSSNATFVPAT